MVAVFHAYILPCHRHAALHFSPLPKEGRFLATRLPLAPHARDDIMMRAAATHRTERAARAAVCASRPAHIVAAGLCVDFAFNTFSAAIYSGRRAHAAVRCRPHDALRSRLENSGHWPLSQSRHWARH